MASVLQVVVVLLFSFFISLEETTGAPSSLSARHFECIPFMIECSNYNRYCKWGRCLPKQTAGGSCSFKTPCRIELACINYRCKKIHKIKPTKATTVTSVKTTKRIITTTTPTTTATTTTTSTTTTPTTTSTTTTTQTTQTQTTQTQTTQTQTTQSQTTQSQTTQSQTTQSTTPITPTTQTAQTGWMQ